MKFEDALPEMRKGRGARPVGDEKFMRLEYLVKGLLTKELLSEWELEPLHEPTVTITRKQFKEIWDSRDLVGAHFEEIADAIGLPEDK